MKRLLVVLAVLLVPAAALAQLTAYPKTSLAEDFTATWCGYCPDAYAGLEVVHSNYDYSEFLSARFYATSGDYGTTETDARMGYYGFSSYPSVVINGTERFVGVGPTTASGAPYMAAVAGAYLDPSPIQIAIDSFSIATGAISVTVTMHSPTDSLVTGDSIVFLILEDNLTAEHTRAVRDVLITGITLSGQGNTAVFNENLDLTYVGNPAQCHALVFVQRQDQEVVQATSTYPIPTYKARATVPFSPMQMGPSTGTYVGELFPIVNVGLADTFSINLVVDEAPAGWVLTYSDEAGTTYTGPTNFSLGTGEFAQWRANITPTTGGYARYHFEVDSPNLASPLVVNFRYITDNVEVLVVDDDGGESFESYFTAALRGAGRSYGVWDLASAKLTTEALQAYHLLVWNVGWSFPSLDAEDRAFLIQYLDDGNKLFITGQDVGWDLADPASDNTDLPFYHNYLHADYIIDDTNVLTLYGVAGDPVGDGLVLSISGGDGANNQDYPSEISAYDSNATGILDYNGTTYEFGAIRAVHGAAGARIVYLAFGFEAINNPTARGGLMLASWKWLLDVMFADGFETGDLSAWSSAVP